MFECRMQADDRHILGLEGFEDSVRLRHAGRDRVRTQHLKRREHDHPSPQARKRAEDDRY